jgi:hypothetical protein
LTNTPNWDSINQSLISIVNSVSDFVEEHAPRVSGETNGCDQSEPQEAEVGKVEVDLLSEAVRILKLAEEKATSGFWNDSAQLSLIADRYIRLAGF